MRPEIAFLEDMRPHSAHRRHSVSRDMIGPAIAEQEEAGDPMLAKEVVEGHRPIREAPAEIDRPVRPVVAVAATEIDAMDGNAMGGDRLAEPAEQRPGRTLQEQEGALTLH